VPHRACLLRPERLGPTLAIQAHPGNGKSDARSTTQKIARLRDGPVSGDVEVEASRHFSTDDHRDTIGDVSPPVRELLIVTYRPGYTPPVGDRTFHTRVALPALTTADSVAMALGWLSVDALPDALQTLLGCQ
jgi:hypothetical protein